MAIAYVTLRTSRGIRMLFDQSERGHSVRTGCTSRGVGTLFDQSEHGYSVRHRAYVRCFNQSERCYGVRHGVYVRFSTNQSTTFSHTNYSGTLWRLAQPRAASRNLTQPQKRGSKTSYYTTFVGMATDALTIYNT